MKAKERHDIKTDRFLETAAMIQAFLLKHIRVILVVIGAAVIIALGWLGINWFMDSREASAAEALNQVVSEHDDAVGAEEADSEELDTIAQQYKDVINKHGNTAGAVIARYHLGLLYLSRRDFESAKENLVAVVESRHPMLWSLAAANMGEIMKGEGDIEEAIRFYRLVADSENTEMPIAYFSYMVGQCYEELGNKEEALSYYTKAKDSGELLYAGDLESEIESSIERLSGELSEES